jgi:methionyl-tRNA formyltransferase
MSKALQIVFAGTPEFAAIALRCLLIAEYKIKAVYTQPDRPRGRGRRLMPSPVKALATTYQLPVYQPSTLRDKVTQAELAALAPDLMVVAAYGLLLPKAILEIPRLGCLNIHASLLPRWRGAAPIQRALLSGDRETGVSIMQMDAGLDTGPVLHTLRCAIQSNDTAATLHERLAALGAQALLECLPALQEGRVHPIPQEERQACYAAKIHKEEAWLNWTLPAACLARQVRAFNPWPIAQTHFDQQVLRVWSATVLAEPTTAAPGTVLAAGKPGIDVATSEGILRLLEVQPTGKRVMAVRDYLNAYALKPGTVFSSLTLA